MKVNFIPKTYLGKWSVYLIISFFVFLGLFFVFVNLGERGGETFFSNLKLTIPMLIAGISGVGSFFTGVISVFKNKEKSVLVFISTLIGLFVLWFVSAEVLFPH